MWKYSVGPTNALLDFRIVNRIESQQIWHPHGNEFADSKMKSMIDYTTRELSESVTVVQVSGALDETNREHFFECIREIIESGSRYVIIECKHLGFINSGTLASLLTARKQAFKHRGRVYLTQLSSNIAEVLEATKLGKLLAVFPSTAAALEHIKSDPACVG